MEAVVPHMGESITDGTLATFLKSMSLLHYLFRFFLMSEYISKS